MSVKLWYGMMVWLVWYGGVDSTNSTKIGKKYKQEITREIYEPLQNHAQEYDTKEEIPVR